ncbi:hypothetical protein DAI22_01g471250 [Oryza sativa Japonica Group]|nr:hypothetical protein DAI22_01g471250 [Oryza sativa Japonica Group]
MLPPLPWRTTVAAAWLVTAVSRWHLDAAHLVGGLARRPRPPPVGTLSSCARRLEPWAHHLRDAMEGGRGRDKEELNYRRPATAAVLPSAGAPALCRPPSRSRARILTPPVRRLYQEGPMPPRSPVDASSPETPPGPLRLPTNRCCLMMLVASKPRRPRNQGQIRSCLCDLHESLRCADAN